MANIRHGSVTKLPDFAVLGNILFVSTDGDDATAEKGNILKPWRNPAIAASAASSATNDVIWILPGVYDFGVGGNYSVSGLVKAGVPVILDGELRQTTAGRSVNVIVSASVGGNYSLTGSGKITAYDGFALISTSSSDAIINIDIEKITRYGGNSATDIAIQGTAYQEINIRLKEWNFRQCRSYIYQCENNRSGNPERGLFIFHADKLYHNDETVVIPGQRPAFYLSNLNNVDINITSIESRWGQGDFLTGFGGVFWWQNNTGASENVKINIKSQSALMVNNSVLANRAFFVIESTPALTQCDVLIDIGYCVSQLQIYKHVTGAHTGNVNIKGRYISTNATGSFCDFGSTADNYTDCIVNWAVRCFTIAGTGTARISGYYKTASNNPCVELTSTTTSVNLYGATIANDGTTAALQGGTVTVNSAGGYQESSNLVDGSVTINKRYEYGGTGGGGTLTNANEGLSLSGTTVQFGSPTPMTKDAAIVGQAGFDAGMFLFDEIGFQANNEFIAQAPLISLLGGPIQTNAGPTIFSDSGSPEGVVTATPGSLYLNSSGGAGTSLYVKESGLGNTGWVAK